jgi:hypothetical protein
MKKNNSLWVFSVFFFLIIGYFTMNSVFYPERINDSTENNYTKRDYEKFCRLYYNREESIKYTFTEVINGEIICKPMVFPDTGIKVYRPKNYPLLSNSIEEETISESSSLLDSEEIHE